MWARCYRQRAGLESTRDVGVTQSVLTSSSDVCGLETGSSVNVDARLSEPDMPRVRGSQPESLTGKNLSKATGHEKKFSSEKINHSDVNQGSLAGLKYQCIPTIKAARGGSRCPTKVVGSALADDVIRRINKSLLESPETTDLRAFPGHGGSQAKRTNVALAHDLHE